MTTRAARLASSSGTPAAVPPLRDRLGVCQWFHYEDYAALEMTIRHLRALGVRHLRTGISWADYYRPGGKAWYDAMLPALAEFDVLLCVWHTPPSISEGRTCASPPRRLRDFADFIDLVITDYGQWFSHLELWNEPNNRWKWDFAQFDPEWRKFGEMVGTAAYWARQRGVPTVLGGMIPVDPHWLALMKRWDAFQHFDAIAIHGFPGMWWTDAPNWDWHRDWRGWPDKVQHLAAHTEGRPVWVTETGLATVAPGRRDEALLEAQGDRLRDVALTCPAERMYWYSLIDLDPALEAIEGFHVDENEYHLGLVRADGRPKPAYELMRTLLHAPDPLALAATARRP